MGKMTFKKLLWVFILIAGIIPKFFAMAEQGVISPSGFQKPEGIKVPFPFLLDDLQGNPRSLSDYKEKVILLHFWATWRGPCWDF